MGRYLPSAEYRSRRLPQDLAGWRVRDCSVGLTDMAGNVWEWTSSWYLPYGAPQHEPAEGHGERVSRGGSFLCSPSRCQGYRASARNHTTPDTSLGNIGFRCVEDPGRVTTLAGHAVVHPH